MTSTTLDSRESILLRMSQENLPQLAIDTFLYYYDALIEGDSGCIRENEIKPVQSLQDADQLDAKYARAGKDVLGQTLMIKLNGGLGTSMGLQKAKSLLKVRGELSFLDIIARQSAYWDVPLVLMNSFVTSQDSNNALSPYSHLGATGLPIEFLQHKVPKINKETLEPVSWESNPALEWCPPGHGDLYTALQTSGLLQLLLEEGYRFAFVSNSDNLGAVMHTGILGYLAEEEIPFLMEVADRTPADRKGGHLAQTPEGQLILRESAQCQEVDLESFQDINRHRYFNTNNLWIDLKALQRLLIEKEGILGLPLIRNEKTVDPRDKSSTVVYQLETAMGAAIQVIAGSGAIRVPRTRFAPVKTTGDLLAVSSDLYELREDASLSLIPERAGHPLKTNLDSANYKKVDDLYHRFPDGFPSLKACTSLKVEGDVTFGKDVVLEGDVHISVPSGESLTIEAGTLIAG